MRARVKAGCVCAAGLFLVTGCGGPVVSTDYQPGFNFSAYNTYGWLAAPTRTDPRLDAELLQSSFRQAVERELGRKGYREDDADPDFRIAYWLSVDEKMNVREIPTYWGYSSSSGAGSGVEPQVDRYEEGTLVIDFVSTRSNQLIWRGTAQGEIDEAPTARQQQAAVEEAVNAILKRFPPD